jgi:hypothetical protein
MDTIYSIFSSLDTIERDFMTYERSEQLSVKPTLSRAGYDSFGFTFVLMRAPELHILSRNVYTLLDFLGDVGGLSGAVQMIFLPIFSVWVPSLFSLDLLNRNFAKDEGTQRNNRRKPDTSKNALLQRLRNPNQDVRLGRDDLAHFF